MAMMLRARIGYRVARQLLRWRWPLQRPRLWQWMQGQYARMAALGNRDAQSFYGHVLLFRGVGLGAREEGLRLLQQAAQAGDAKAAYQVGLVCLQGSDMRAADRDGAVRWWRTAADAGHPLAAKRLADLLRHGGEGVAADEAGARHYEALASRHGL